MILRCLLFCSSKTEKKLKMRPRRTPFDGILSKNHCSIFFGTFLFTVGLILIVLKTWLLELLTTSALILKPNSLIESSWTKVPIDIPTSVYLFNWTNPEDFGNLRIKPKFEQVGPYTFKQNLEKVNVVWNDNNTVTYNQVRTFSYITDNTNGNMSDKITTLNAITMATSHYLQNWNYILKKGFSVFLSTLYPDVHIERTVNQLLLEGYDDVIVDLAHYLPFIASEIPRFDKFGWFLIMNGSDSFDGTFNLATGVDGKFDLRRWNYNKHIPEFDGTCSEVRGFMGELFSRHLTKDHIGLFVPQICRELRLDYEEEVYLNGILGYKYVVGDSVLDNGTIIPENKCYCSGDCLPYGVFNMSSCRYGLPTFGSLPNFYQADPVYIEAIEGLHPDKNKHESYVVLEPTTGMPLKVALRIQLNFLVHPIEDILVYEDVPEVFFPLLWVEVTLEMPSFLLVLLKIYLLTPYILTGIGAIVMVAGLYVLIFIGYRPIFILMYQKLNENTKLNTLMEEEEEEEVPLKSDVEMAYLNILVKDEFT